MERCLLSAHGDVFRVPWEDLVYPQFISRPRTSGRQTSEDDKAASVKDGTMLINTAHNLSIKQDNKDETNLSNPSNKHTLRQEAAPLLSSVKQSAGSSDESDSEGEYVELTELPLPRFSPQKGSLTQSISQQHKARTSAQTAALDATQTVPIQSAIQSPQKHLPAASKASSSSRTESHTGLCPKPIEENDARGVNGPVILSPVSQASSFSSCAGTSLCQEQTEGTNPVKKYKGLDYQPTNSTLQDEEKEREVFEKMDIVAVIVDGLDNVGEDLREEREDGESVEEVETVGDAENTGEETAVVQEIIVQQEENQGDQCELESVDIFEGQIQCRDSGLPDAQVQTQQTLSEGNSELLNTQDTHIEATKPNNSEIIDAVGAYVGTVGTLNLVPEETEMQGEHTNKTKFEQSENYELSDTQDAIVENNNVITHLLCEEIEIHSQLLQTQDIHSEETNSENSELSDRQDTTGENVKADFVETGSQNVFLNMDKLQETFIEELEQSRPDINCEMENNAAYSELFQTQKQEFVELDPAGTQNTVEKAETHFRSAQERDTQGKPSEDTECTFSDSDKKQCSKQTHCEESQTLSNMEIVQDSPPDTMQCTQSELCNKQQPHCEETVAHVFSCMEIMQDTSSERDTQNTEFELKTEMQLTNSELSNNELELEHTTSEIVDTLSNRVEIQSTVTEETDSELAKTHDTCPEGKVMMRDIKSPTEEMPKNSTQIDTPETHFEIGETQVVYVEKVAKSQEMHFEEKVMHNEPLSSTSSTQEEKADTQEGREIVNKPFKMDETLYTVSEKAQDVTYELDGKVEMEYTQTEETKMQDSVEILQNLDIQLALQMDKTLKLPEISHIQDGLSQEVIETVGNTNLFNTQEVEKMNTQQTPSNVQMIQDMNLEAEKQQVVNVELFPIQSVEIKRPCPQTEKTETEHIPSSSDITLHTNTEETQHTNCEVSKTEGNQAEKLEEMVTPVIGLGSSWTEAEPKYGPKHGCKYEKREESREVKIITQHVHSERLKSQEIQPEMLKVQQTNSDSKNGPKDGLTEKIGEPKEVVQLKNCQNRDEVLIEGSSTVRPEVSLSNGSIPKVSGQPPAALHLNPSAPGQLSQLSQSRFNRVLLSSGVLCLPGTRDRSGRALLTVYTKNTVWSNPDCDSAELFHLLVYYTSTLRKDVRALGLTVLVDARRAPPVTSLFSAFRDLQESTPGSIHTVLLLINKDSPVRLDKPPSLQVEMLNSMKSLQKHVELRQLPAEFGGSFNFSQSSWLCYRSRVEKLTNQCRNVISLLQKTIDILESTPLPDKAENAELLLSKYKAVMCSILQDSRLVQLQQEGGASLSRLRRDESSISVTEDYRAALESVSSLYDQVDELLHRLVTLSNSKTQELQFIVEFNELENGFTEVRTWIEDIGEVHLKSLDGPEDSLELLIKNQTDYKKFCDTAYDWCKRGQALLQRLEHWDNISSADLQAYEVKVHSFWAQLQGFSQRINITGKNIDEGVRLYRFLDQAYGWALEGMRHLAGVSMEECTLPDKCQTVISCLEDYNHHHPPIPEARFQEMKALAGELRGERGLRQWSFAWAKCQETKKMFDRKMEAALRTRDSTHRRRSDSSFSRKSLSGLWITKEATQMSLNQPEGNTSCPSPPRNSTASPVTSTPQHTPLLQRLFRSTSTDDTKDRLDISSSPAPSLQRLDSTSSFTSSYTSPSICSSSSYTPLGRRQQLRKTQSFDCPPTPEVSRYGACPRTLSEPARRGNTGVFIRGLEVTSTEAADRTLCPRTGAQGLAGQGTKSPSTPSINRSTDSTAADPRPRGSKLRHIVEEMVTTEQEYVRSLRYIIHHYFPEMDRPDVPQDLRGKRSVVFGNLEKLLDFHSQFFLKELEACWKHPLRVPHCFLRHQEQFSLYALYSKNKPKSDTLLAHHGNAFFRRKQVELGDKMDLSSYLLKPIQRMSKYALLLTDLMKEVGVSQEAELNALHAATSMVKFQLRHGNDLLAMDAIRDCDVNLKEQGQLIRQDEFTVWTGRKKCQRHIFLFEDLVLFSKPKRMEGGLDFFIYKHSFKTADVGLTESTGDDGLRFEIWFRRRTSRNQTFILQASTSEVKLAWTTDIARILWTQAARNKEMRLKEMVSMGVGNKPFLDIQPSDAAISDRAVHYIMKSRGARTRASIAVSVFDHSHPFKRSAVTHDPPGSGPSSTSLLGPLNLHMFSQVLPSAAQAEGSFMTSCIEEDEQEHETSSQPSMTTESSGSSSRCLSGSTGSDSGCVSSHLQETLQEEPGPCQPSSSKAPPTNKQHLHSQYISANTGAVIGPATIV